MVAEVWWSSLAAANHDLLAVLDDTERGRVQSLQRPADRGRSLLGAALLRVAVAAHLGVAPGEVTVDRECPECGGPHGAPRITGPGAVTPWVSVSHSGLLVAVAVSADGPVGVDVQRVSDLADPGTGREWVQREALLKARSGASGGRTVTGPGALAPDGSAYDGGAYDVSAYDLRPPLPGYVASLVAPAEAGAEPVVRHWPPSVWTEGRHPGQDGPSTSYAS